MPRFQARFPKQRRCINERMSGSLLRRVRVAEVERVANRIKRFRLVDAENAPLSEFSGGSHISVVMHSGDRLMRNPYSLMGSPTDTSSYQISVLNCERFTRRLEVHA